jgi:hypothetical protein
MWIKNQEGAVIFPFNPLALFLIETEDLICLLLSLSYILPQSRVFPDKLPTIHPPPTKARRHQQHQPKHVTRGKLRQAPQAVLHGSIISRNGLGLARFFGSSD